MLGEALALEMEYENRITEEKKLPGNLTKEQLLANTGAMTGDVLAVGNVSNGLKISILIC